jgi:thiol:disulfide interchange protein
VPIPASLATSEAYFFPLTDGALAYAAPQAVSRSGDTLIVETDAGSQTGTLEAIEGVLKIGDHQGLAFRAMPGTVPATGVALAPAAETAQAGGTVLAALIGALIGGLLLNIMPCVFPILSLKAISLAKAGGDERSARREALAYTAGAVAICLALGAALLAIRSGGAAAGWAFQLQDPRVILFLLLLVTAIALNLSGLFELPSLGGRVAQAQGAQGAFWTGALGRLHRHPLHRARSWVPRSAPRWFCPPRPRSPCSPASGWGSRSPSSCSASCPRCVAACPDPAPGWSASAG